MTTQTQLRREKRRKTARKAKRSVSPIPFNDTYRNGKRDSGGKSVFELYDERHPKARRVRSAATPKAREANPDHSKNQPSTWGSDVYHNGKRVTKGPTVFELLALREKQRESASRSSRPNRNGKQPKRNGDLPHS